MARSWLEIGTSIHILEAQVGFDVVILSRGAAPSGHVGFFAGWDKGQIRVLGGNQGNRVSIATFPKERILGVRRLR